MMFFYDNDHQKNYHELMRQFPSALGNTEYKVAYYIVAHPEIYHKVKGYNLAYPFVDWYEKEDFSRGIRFLVDLGLHLYGGGDSDFNLMDAMATWDDRNYRVFKQACDIRRGIV